MKDIEKTFLTKQEHEALEEAVRTLKGQFRVEKVILFGSKARGDYDEYSDIDLLLITNRPLHWKEEKAMVEALFDIGMAHDVIFSPLFTSTEEWKGGVFTEFPIYQDIMREGAVIV